jgi:hypothetical protein
LKSFATSIVLTASAVLCFESSAHAYIDPGSTSLLLQGIVGAVAAILVITKAYWRRAIALFRRRSDGTEPPAASS